MTLEELGRQYLENVDILTARIHVLNKQINTLTGNDKIILKRRIASLYFDAAECRSHAKKLINYHKKESFK